MSNSESVEKTRQAIMRLNELLGLMRQRLEGGERAYKQLFAGISPEQQASMKEKDLQLLAAQQNLHDLSGLKRAALELRFHARDLEKAFEELYDALVVEAIE